MQAFASTIALEGAPRSTPRRSTETTNWSGFCSVAARRRGTFAIPWARSPRPTRGDGYTKTLNLLVAVREAGSWQSYVDAPRLELHALRRELSSLRKGGRAPPSSTYPLHERLFVQAPDDIFTHTIAFWRGDRDS